jgi:hypothetical protein
MLPCRLGETRGEKANIIKIALVNQGLALTERNGSDREHDYNRRKKCGLLSVGVLYGSAVSATYPGRRRRYRRKVSDIPLLYTDFLTE